MMASRLFCVDLEAQAKAELAEMIKQGQNRVIEQGKPQMKVKLVSFDEKTIMPSSEHQAMLESAIKAIKTEDRLAQFMIENEDIVKGRALLQLLEQLFAVYDRTKRAGSTITLEEYIASPLIKPLFDSILSKYRKLNGSQLAAFIVMLSSKNYKDISLYRDIEDHLATARHTPAFNSSANQLLRCLSSLSAAGLKLSISLGQVNAIASNAKHSIMDQSPSKAASLIFYYHKLVTQITHQHERSAMAQDRANRSDQNVYVDADTHAHDREDVYESMQNIEQNTRTARKLCFDGIELVDFYDLVQHTAGQMELPSVSLALNGYAYLGNHRDDRPVSILIDRLRKCMDLHDIAGILSSLKACVNVGIKDASMFKDIVDETTRQVTLIEDRLIIEYSTECMLMIHYYFVKFDVCYC